MSHALLSPSAAHRWMACPGSLLAEAGVPDQSSPAAMEGTAAHELAEECGREGIDPYDQIGRVIQVDDESNGVTVTEDVEITYEMADAVQQFLDYQSSVRGTGESFGFEVLVSPDSDSPKMRDCWGTADFWAYNSTDRTLHIADLKYGKGVRVYAADNPQLKLYALGVMQMLRNIARRSGLSYPTQRVVCAIVQPRISQEPDTVSYTIEELDSFREEMRQYAAAALAENAPRHPGTHCQFCKVRPTCRVAALTGAQEDFMSQDIERVAQQELVAPDDMTTDEMAEMLAFADRLAKWAKEARTELHKRAEAGEAVNGYKVVDKRPRRVWAESESQVHKALRPHVDKPAQLYKKELLTPAQMEKIIDPEVVAELVSSVSSGTTLAPESDSRPAVNAAAEDEFSVETQQTLSLEDLL